MTLQQLILRSVTAGFAIMFTATVANAYSDEAIKDAQRQLDWMTQRFQSGTASHADVARAHYQLFDMRRRTGKMTHAAFCKAAQPELSEVALRFEEDDAPAGEKAQWQAEIAAMTKSPTSCDRAVVTSDRLLYGYSEPTNSQSGVKEAEDRVSVAEQRVAAGTMKTRDLEQARYELLAAKYGAKQIVLKAYCDGGLRHLGLIADVTEQEFREGRSDLGSVIGARLNLHRLEATCRAN
jgi:hypothetical protein